MLVDRESHTVPGETDGGPGRSRGPFGDGFTVGSMGELMATMVRNDIRTRGM